MSKIRKITFVLGTRPQIIKSQPIISELINQKFNKGKQFRKANSPYNAINLFLKTNKDFVIESYYENKSFLTNIRNGFLKKIK